jgi:hypothetical protein
MYFSLVAVWFVVSIPLTYVGGYAALRIPIPDNPVKTNQIPRHIPPPPISANPTLLFLAGEAACGCFCLGGLRGADQNPTLMLQADAADTG